MTLRLTVVLTLLLAGCGDRTPAPAPVNSTESDEAPLVEGTVSIFSGNGVRVDYDGWLGLMSAPEGTGLEKDDYRDLALVIRLQEGLAEATGITEERVRDRVELRMRTAGLRPAADWISIEPRLDVTLRGGVGQSFNIDVSLFRNTPYVVTGSDVIDSQVFRRDIATWWTRGAGIHTNDAGFIMDNLDMHLDEFLNEYLKANATDGN